jgi:hypothetical protein
MRSAYLLALPFTAKAVQKQLPQQWCPNKMFSLLEDVSIATAVGSDEIA